MTRRSSGAKGGKGGEGTRRRIAGSGTRRTVATKATESGLALDDRPLAIVPMRDGKRLLVVLPYELWTVEREGEELRFVQNIELRSARPSVSEGEGGSLWIGGDHLFRGRAFATEHEKFGSKLGGFVDHVAVLRPGLLAGVGPRGEVLIDTQKEAVIHQRKSKEGTATSVCASADERAIFADQSGAAWVIDPAHPGGYTQLRFETRSEHDPPEEAIVRVQVDGRGRCLIAARDGAVAWTRPSLRREGEAYAPLPAGERACLALDADRWWMYALRPRGRLQRFLLEAPPPPEPEPEPSTGRGRPAPEPPAPPAHEELRLSRPASCMACIETEEGPRLVVGGPRNDGTLGRLWLEDPAKLEWQALPLAERPTRPAPAPEEKSAPNFAQVRNKLPADAPNVASLSVDEVIGGKVHFWIAQGSGALTERALGRVAAEALLPADLLLLPAMIRPKSGTARPALYVWPGVPVEREVPTPEGRWLCWGDEPRGWMRLDTPAMREQRWVRSDFFPMQVALLSRPDAPGRRPPIPKRWGDREAFEAMARECKKLLEVLW